MTRKRQLSPEEKALWESVARRAEPLKQLSPAPVVQTKPASGFMKRPDRKPDPVVPPVSKPVRHTHKKHQPLNRHDIAPPIAQQMRDAPVHMDRKAYGRMKRGKLLPEARIDLHGMTLAQAHPVLTGFIMRSVSSGHRLVLVITGKGKNRDDGNAIPTRFGVLRHQVPQWLHMAPLAGMVLQVTPAHGRHGGEGAYYVYLRRPR